VEELAATKQVIARFAELRQAEVHGGSTRPELGRRKRGAAFG